MVPETVRRRWFGAGGSRRERRRRLDPDHAVDDEVVAELPDDELPVPDPLELDPMFGHVWAADPFGGVVVDPDGELDPEVPDVVELEPLPELVLVPAEPLVATVVAWVVTAAVLVAPATSMPIPRLSPRDPATTPAATTGLLSFIALSLHWRAEAPDVLAGDDVPDGRLAYL